MQSYKLLWQVEIIQLKNKIKSIITNPKRLISYTLYIAFMIFIVVFNTKNMQGRSSDSITQFAKYFGAGALIMVGFMMFTMMRKSSLNFKLSEINLIFTAPIDPRKILLFNLFKRIPLYILTSVYTLVFLLSLILGSVEATVEGVVITCIGYALVFLIIEPLSFTLFVLGLQLKKENLQIKVTQIIFIFIGGALIYALYDAYSVYGFNLEALLNGLNYDWLNYIPIIGWSRYLILSAVMGVTFKTYVFLVLMITTYITFVLTTFYLGHDYYEDVIQTSEQKSQLMKAAKSGKGYQFNIGFNKKSVKTKDNKKYGQALDWKRKLMVKKKDISVYFSFETLLLLLAITGIRIFTGDDLIEEGLFMVAGAYVYMKFLFSSTGNLDDEISKPYFFLIPDTGTNKIIQVLKTDLERIFISGSLMVLAQSIYHMTFRLEWILFPVALTMVISLFMFSGILLSLFLPNGDAKTFLVLLKMLQIVLLLLPSTILSLIVGLVYESIFFAVLSNVLVNSLIILIFLSLSNKIINRMELK